VKKLIVLVLGAMAIALVAAPAFATNDDDTPGGDKVFVCKYVGPPGVDEVLQTGMNPISVDTHSLDTYPDVAVGDTFTDAQGHSVVVAFDTGQDPEPACPTATPTEPPPTPTTPPPTTPPPTPTPTTPAPSPTETPSPTVTPTPSPTVAPTHHPHHPTIELKASATAETFCARAHAQLEVSVRNDTRLGGGSINAFVVVNGKTIALRHILPQSGLDVGHRIKIGSRFRVWTNLGHGPITLVKGHAPKACVLGETAVNAPTGTAFTGSNTVPLTALAGLFLLLGTGLIWKTRRA
jgi:hypothetical protein